MNGGLQRGTIRLELADDRLIVANVGDPFTRVGILSLRGRGISAKTAPLEDPFPSVADGIPWLTQIREQSLLTYRNEPTRLLEDPRNERQTSTDYAGRLVLELLQNAHDAACPPAARIGQYGLGFKSVLAVSEEIDVFSGPFSVRFGKSEAASALKHAGLTVPEDVPVFRLPTPATPDVIVEDALRDGFSTVITLRIRPEARDIVVASLEALQPEHLLFVPSLRCLQVCAGVSPGARWSTSAQPAPDGGEFVHIEGVDFRQGMSRTSGRWRRWLVANSGGRVTAGLAVPLDEPPASLGGSPTKLSVFFPTNDTLGMRALVHVDAPLGSDRKHLSEDAGTHSSISSLLQLVGTAATSLPPTMTLDLLLPHAPDSGASTGIAASITAKLKDTAFVPIYGGARARPTETRIFPELGLLQGFLTAGAVSGAPLLEPGELLSDSYTAALTQLGARALAIEERVRLLPSIRVLDAQGSTEALRLLGPMLEGWERSTPAAVRLVLDQIPLLWTTRARARAAKTAGEKAIDARGFYRELVSPTWLTIETLDEAVAQVLPEFALWKRLALTRDAEAHVREVVLPQVTGATEAFWNRHGWSVLQYLDAVLATKLSENEQTNTLMPLVPGRTSTRAEISKEVHVPNRRGQWVRANALFASPAWGRDADFSPSVSSPEKLEVADPIDWAADGKWHGDEARTKRLLTYLGVSWGPKLEASPQGVRLQSFPSCLRKVDAVERRAALLLPIMGALKASQASPGLAVSPAFHQLREEPWVPVKPAFLGGDASHVSPARVWLREPDRIRGLVSVVRFSADGPGSAQANTTALLLELGARDTDPGVAEYQSWLGELVSVLKESESFEAECHQPSGKHAKLSLELTKSYLTALASTPPLTPVTPPPKLIALNLRTKGRVLVAAEVAKIAWADTDELDRSEVIEAIPNQPILVWRRPPVGKGIEHALDRLGLLRLSKVTSSQLTFDADDEACIEPPRRVAAYWKVLCAGGPDLEAPSVRMVRGLHLSLSFDGRPLPLVPLGGEYDELHRRCLVESSAPERGLGKALSKMLRAYRGRTAAWIELVLLEASVEGALGRLDEIPLSQEQRDQVRRELTGIGTDETASQESPDDGAHKKGVEGASAKASETSAPARTVKSRDGGSDGATQSRGSPAKTPEAQDKESQSPGRGAASSQDESDASETVTDVVGHTRRLRRGPSIRGRGRPPDASGGYEAEVWLQRMLQAETTAFPGLRIQRNPYDERNAQSDFVLEYKQRTAHIEVKHSKTGSVFWSAREIQKSDRESRAGNKTWLLVVRPANGGYDCFWFQEPARTLRGMPCDVQHSYQSYFECYSGAWPPDDVNPRDLPAEGGYFSSRLRFRLRDVARLSARTAGADALRPVRAWLEAARGG